MCTPQRLLCQCLTSWSDTPSLVPQPKGGLRFALLSPPKVGTAGEVHCSRAPRRTAILDGAGVLVEGVPAPLGPCGCIGDLHLLSIFR